MTHKRKIIVTQESGFLRVVLPDAIGMDEGRVFEKEIRAHFLHENTQVVLDFSKTTALYSSGIGLLITLQKELKKHTGTLCLVNVSRKIKELLANLNMDRVFQIFTTDVEFELSKDEIWEKRLADEDPGFIFVAQIEDDIYHLTFSGIMSSMNDLSAIGEFNPDEEIKQFVFNLQNLDLLDTYGAQLFNDFTDKLLNMGKKCAVWGANQMIRDLFEVFPGKNRPEFFAAETEAVKSFKRNRKK